MAGDRQGPRPSRAMGQDKNTEGSSDRWPVPSCCACMQGGGNHKAGGRAGKGEGEKKKHEQNLAATQEGEKRRASGRRGNGLEQMGRRETAAGARKKRQKQQPRVTRWGKGMDNGGRGGQEEGTTTGPEVSTPPKRKGTGRERTVQVALAGPR